MPDKPRVAVIMGSKSDWETMRHAAETLEALGIPARVSRRLRAPHARLDGEVRRGGGGAGTRGRSSRAPAARHTCPEWSRRKRRFPSWACPSRARRCRVSTRFSRSCRCREAIPVATFAIGKAGAINAALFAAAILARTDVCRPRCPCALPGGPDEAGCSRIPFLDADGAPGRHDRRARERPARPHVRDRRPADGLPGPHLLARRRHADRAGRRRRSDGAVRRPRSRARVRQTRRRRHVRVRERLRRRRGGRRRAAPSSGPAETCSTSASTGSAKRRSSRARGFPVAPYRVVRSRDELARGLGELGAPAVLKRAGFSYDGKGQARVATAEEAEAAWDAIGREEAVLEQFVEFDHEVSVIVARGLDGEPPNSASCATRTRATSSTTPSSMSPIPRAPEGDRDRARASRSGSISSGVLCVELFVMPDGNLLVNELAPRPHNSGHLTIDACVDEPVRAAVAGRLRASARFDPAAERRRHGEPAGRPLDRRASPTGPPRARFPRRSSTSTGRASRGRAGRWATSRRSPRSPAKRFASRSPRARR